MTFYLGIADPSWIARLSVPMFLSIRRLRDRKTLPRALGPWALDSGGFTELVLNGSWTTRARRYAREVRWIREEIGNLQWAATQDWMNEPVVLQKTGYRIKDHILLTVQNAMALLDAAPELPWAPVLQGWTLDHYEASLDLYERWGINVRLAPACGIGTMCRRQAMDEAVKILTVAKCEWGIPNLHGFGFKLTGLGRAHPFLGSADSMAWSFNGRRLGGNLQNSILHAMAWREKALARCPGWDEDEWDASILDRPSLRSDHPNLFAAV